MTNKALIAAITVVFVGIVAVAILEYNRVPLSDIAETLTDTIHDTVEDLNIIEDATPDS